MKVKRFSLVFFLLFFLIQSSETIGGNISDNKNLDTSTSPTVIQIGKVTANWKGLMGMLFWANTETFLKYVESVVLPADVNSFRFGLVFKGENSIGLDEKCMVITKVEVESKPKSDEWIPMFEINQAFNCKKYQSIEEPFYTHTIFQKEDIARYKITVESNLPIGPKSKITYIYVTVRLDTKTFSTYTSIPFIPLTILHDPSGDQSFTGLLVGASINNLLSLKLGGYILEPRNQQEIVFETPKAKLTVKPSYDGKKFINMAFQPSGEIKSETESIEPCLIGPGLGDVYIIAKNLPVKLSYSKPLMLGEKSKLYFNIVSETEAGFDSKTKFELFVLPVATLRSFKDNCSFFGSWKAIGIPDEVRNQLIDLNAGWNNLIEKEEESNVLKLGEAYLNPQEDFKQWIQPQLKQEISIVPIRIGLKVQVDPVFTNVASIPTIDGIGRLEVILNENEAAPVYTFKDMLIQLGDDETRHKAQGTMTQVCSENTASALSDERPDFFSYQIYLDRRFGTLIFITNDNKNKPADLTSIHERSISSHPHEYWTEGYTGNIIARVNVGATIEGTITDTGLPISGAVFKQDGQPIKTKYMENNRYMIEGLSAQKHIISVEAEGFLGISKIVDVIFSKNVEIIFNLLPVIEPDNKPAQGTISLVPETLPLPEVKETKELQMPATVTLPSVVTKAIEPLPFVVEKPTLPAKPQDILPSTETTPLAEKKQTTLLKKIQSINLINSDFSKGIIGWNRISVGPQGKVKIGVIRENIQYPHILNVSRKSSEKGRTGVQQRIIGVDASLLPCLRVKANIKVISSSIENDKNKDYPAIIEVWYRDAKGELQSWSHGFICDKELIHPELGQVVKENTWIDYISPDLTKIKPTPKNLVMFRLYGAGNSFEFRVANVALDVTSQSTETESSSENVSSDEKILIQTQVKPNGLITNPNFDEGLNGWNVFKTGPGQIYVLTSNENPHILSIARENSGRIKGNAGVRQELNIDIHNYSCLKIKAKLKAISCSINSDGTKGGVYPINLELQYEDMQGHPQIWRHGFLPNGKRLNYPEIGQIIPTDTWFNWVSEDLTKITPEPKRITGIRIYGNGWAFESQVCLIEIMDKQ